MTANLIEMRAIRSGKYISIVLKDHTIDIYVNYQKG